MSDWQALEGPQCSSFQLSDEARRDPGDQWLQTSHILYGQGSEDTSKKANNSLWFRGRSGNRIIRWIFRRIICLKIYAYLCCNIKKGRHFIFWVIVFGNILLSTLNAWFWRSDILYPDVHSNSSCILISSQKPLLVLSCCVRVSCHCSLARLHLAGGSKYFQPARQIRQFSYCLALSGNEGFIEEIAIWTFGPVLLSFPITFLGHFWQVYKVLTIYYASVFNISL